MHSSEHLKLNQFLLECFGIWPHQSKIAKCRNYLIFATCSLSLILPLFQGLLEMSSKNVILFFGTIVAIMYLVGGLYLATTLYIYPYHLTRIFEQMESDLNGIIHEEDLTTMNEFSQRAKSFILRFIGMSFATSLMYTIFNYLPMVFRNAQTYSAMFSNYSNQWIINENVHKLQKIVHFNLVVFYTSLMYITSLGVYMSTVEHACGMYTIVSNRLKKVTRVARIVSCNLTNDNDHVGTELINIVAKHRKAIKSAYLINEAFGKLFYLIQIGEMICMAIFIFALQYSINSKSTHLVLRVISWGMVFMLYTFCLHYGGEQIIDFSNRVFIATYFANWHLMSLEARKKLTMIIVRSCQGDKLNSATITLSLENFSRIMYISWSMAATLLSIQKDV